MRRAAPLLLILTLAVAAAYAPRSRAQASTHSFAYPAKKVCKSVKKKVKGRTVTVKTCTKTKPVPTPTFPPTLTPTPVDVESVAEGIGDDVTQAQDPDDRYHAVLEAMQQLNVGVYTAEGGAVNRGGETGDGDLYTYDFELRGISESIDSGRTWTLDDAARILQAQNLQTAGGTPLDANAVRAMLVSSVQNAMSDAHNPQELSYLLLRALGLRHAAPYDLAQNPPVSQIQLDALQLALITLEFDIPVALQARATSGGLEAARVHSPGSGEICGDGISGASNWLFTPLAVKDSGSDVLTQLVSSFHQVLLGVFDLQIQGSTPDGTSTQYGQGGQPGHALRYVATVNLLNSPEETVQCGILADLNLPNSGPIAGAAVTWDPGGLDKYGSVTYAPVSGITGADGTSTMTFQPNEDTNPGGAQQTKSGTVQVRVTSLAKADPSIKSLLDLAGLSPASFPWQVSYHSSTP